MIAYVLIFLVCLLVCCTIMFVVWRWAVRIRNAGVVDVFWAFNFPVIAIVLFFLAPGWPLRKTLICIMVLAAGTRLGIHLYQRVIGHLDEEEGRYKQLRTEWAPNADRKFGWFFQVQAMSNVLLAIPFIIIASNPWAGFSAWELAGAALWALALTGEAAADKQLADFKKDPANKGRVCDTGLWSYSRHPNYFFEWLTWVAYFVFAQASPHGWIAIFSPAIILYLLLKVTGIPATEEQSIRSKGELYKNYQRKTSVFIPWFKKTK